MTFTHRPIQYRRTAQYACIYWIEVLVTNVKLWVDGRRRTFALHLPAMPKPDLPLLLVLHGHRSSLLGPLQRSVESRGQRTAGFGPCIERYDIAVAYPDAYTGRWADGRGVSRDEQRGVDDVAFLRAVAEHCADRFGTCGSDVLVAGISNGAFMAHRMALEAADLVTAFLSIAGGLPAALTDVRPTHAVSALLINGTADRIVPIGGGHSRRRGPNDELLGRTLSLTESAQHWAELDRCAGEAVVEQTPAGPGPADLAVTRHTASAGVGGTRVAAWSIDGMGHTWPGTPAPAFMESLLGKTPQNIDAADEFCRFALRANPGDRRL
ncbi:alpha/beta hydrolase family esterase [Nocardia sp. NPDC101769]|uniref:alpha/beta hydrolase family esterase n=1 Tax=Nocardia sp. NPDC101769 TaxID=3364333 RepID=UPI003803D6E6